MRKPVRKGVRRFQDGGSVPPIRDQINPNSMSQQIKSGMQMGMDIARMSQGMNKGGGDSGTPDTSMLGGAGPGNPTAGVRKGGPIRKTHGPKIGKEDGLIAAQKGEYVIRKSAVKKLGTRVLSQINKGKLPEHKGKR